jgi:hypothetical protein
MQDSVSSVLLDSDEHSKRKSWKASKTKKGRQIFKRIVKCLTMTHPVKLLPYQLQFCETCTIPLIPAIYGKDFRKNAHDICKTHGITAEDLFKEVACIAPRRKGKSMTTAMLADAACLSIPSSGVRPFTVLVFSPTWPQSKEFIKECSRMLNSMPYTDEFEISIKSQEIEFRSKSNPSDTKIIRSLCGSQVRTCVIFFLSCIFLDMGYVMRKGGSKMARCTNEATKKRKASMHCLPLDYCFWMRLIFAHTSKWLVFFVLVDRLWIDPGGKKRGE